MASAMHRARASAAVALRGVEANVLVAASALGRRAFASLATGTDIVSAAPGVSLQKARSWDEGVSSKFSTTPLKDIFEGRKVVIFGLPGAYTGVCSQQHVPSYKNNIEKFKTKGIDSVICVAVNDPYSLNGWAEKLQAKEAIDFYGDFDGSFHKSLELDVDLSGALLGRRSHRNYSARTPDTACIQRPIRCSHVIWYQAVMSRSTEQYRAEGDGIHFHWAPDGVRRPHRIISRINVQAYLRWSAYIVDGKVQSLNVEKKPSDFEVSSAEVILEQI